MNGNKLFAASIAILALALGFFLGTLKGSCCAPCEHSAMNAPCDCTKGLPCSCEKNGQPCHCPNCAKHDHKGPHGDFDKGPKFKGPNFAAIDSLESKDAAGIDAAKAKVLEADKALLEHRINGMAALGKILTAEQLEKFNNFHKEQMRNFRERMNNGPKGHGPHPGMGHGPHHN